MTPRSGPNKTAPAAVLHGSMPNDTIKTFSRGGSDVTGSIVAKAVKADLYDRTEVSGVNETGKSTIKRAIQYIFGCRDENGAHVL